MLNGIILALLCFAAGCVSHFAMAPYNLGIVLFFGIPALYYALQRAETRKIKFLFSWLFAFGYFVCSLSWISNALLVPGNEDFYWAYPFALVGLPTVLALFPAFCITFIAGRYDLEHLGGWWAFVIALAISEVARGFLFTGFPWNSYGYTWIKVIPIAQVASIGGIYFLTTLTIFWAATPALIFLHKRQTPVLITFFITAFTITGAYGWGYYRTKTEPLFIMQDVTLHLIQPNIAQEDKWAKGKLQSHFDNLVELSSTSLETHEDRMNVFIWPETASVTSIMFNEENMETLKTIIPEDKNNFLATGLLNVEKREESLAYYNSLTILGPGQNLVGNYNKHHLVPFGEYIPFKNFIPLEPIVKFSGFEAGPGPRRLKITPSFSISPLICYEIIFPGKSVPRDSRQKPNLIVNVTNDAWYGDSAGPQQHLVQAQFRAIESGLPVARVANTGVSALISPLGNVVRKIRYGARGARSHSLILPLQSETYFAKFKFKILFALLASLVLGGYIFKKEH